MIIGIIRKSACKSFCQHLVDITGQRTCILGWELLSSSIHSFFSSIAERLARRVNALSVLWSRLFSLNEELLSLQIRFSVLEEPHGLHARLNSLSRQSTTQTTSFQRLPLLCSANKRGVDKLALRTIFRPALSPQQALQNTSSFAFDRKAYAKKCCSLKGKRTFLQRESFNWAGHCEKLIIALLVSILSSFSGATWDWNVAILRVDFEIKRFVKHS